MRLDSNPQVIHPIFQAVPLRNMENRPYERVQLRDVKNGEVVDNGALLDTSIMDELRAEIEKQVGPLRQHVNALNVENTQVRQHLNALNVENTQMRQQFNAELRAEIEKQVGPLRQHLNALNVENTQMCQQFNAELRAEIEKQVGPLRVENTQMRATIDQIDKKLNCPICQVTNKNVVLFCGHMFCNSCVERMIQEVTAMCPICNEKTNPDFSNPTTNSPVKRCFL